MHLPLNDITFDEIKADFLADNNITLTVLRLDKIHKEVSGNKLFKLHYYIDACLLSNHKTLLTFGGAYSNHLAATAFLCKEKDIKSIGIVRGEEPKNLSHTLAYCKDQGMELCFVSRDAYKKVSDSNLVPLLKQTYGEFTLIPEGGYDQTGANGASKIMDLLGNKTPSHICVSVGTGTTLAGLLLNSDKVKNIIAVTAIKNMNDIDKRLIHLIKLYPKEKLSIFRDYHFGGYAKYNDELLSFMNDFYAQYKIPTDFVYTAKMMYAIIQKIKEGYFEKNSNIMCLHTGGLQGNGSLINSELIF